MGIENWVDFFKSEVRSAGQAFAAKGQVALMRPTDTELQAYVRASSSFKVQLKSPSMDSPLLTATCTCPQSKKGQFCKHMWATIVVVEEKNPDFLISKTELLTAASDATSAQGPQLSQKQLDSQAAYKAKQADYRKQQYQLQKERAQKFKKPKTSKLAPPMEFPSDVESALSYFEGNGFNLRDSLNAEDIGLARKKLARVFHPDRGGSHDEIVELNKNTEILLKFI